MSGPPTSLPAQIAELRTVDVTWEAATAQDGYAQPGYAAPVTLKAWVEPFGFSVGGVEATRRPEETTVEPQYELYFRGDDVAPRSMTTLDRFTLPSTVDAQQRPLQAIRIAELAGPPFDSVTPWIIAVTL